MRQPREFELTHRKLSIVGDISSNISHLMAAENIKHLGAGKHLGYNKKQTRSWLPCYFLKQIEENKRLDTRNRGRNWFTHEMATFRFSMHCVFASWARLFIFLCVSPINITKELCQYCLSTLNPSRENAQ